MKWYKLFYLFSSLLLVSIGGLFSVIFYLNEDLHRCFIFVGITAALLLVFIFLFIFFTTRERRLVKKALGDYRMSFSGLVKIDSGSSFEVDAKFYDNGILIAEKGETLVPFVYEKDVIVESHKFSIDLNIHKLGVVRFLSNTTVKIKAIANLFS